LKEAWVTEVTEYQIEGVRAYDLEKRIDERGFFAEVLRKGWKELLGDEWIAQVSVSMSYPGIIRAWHRHVKGQVDYWVVIQGALKIAAYDDQDSSPTRGQIVEIVASEDKLQVVRVPGHYWHGTKALGFKPSITLYFSTQLYDYANPDEERRPWNDTSIVDPRTNQPYDWNRLPYR
jgi:dTDP-4-dehydrorhamnose 3,5-epimerase